MRALSAARSSRSRVSVCALYELMRAMDSWRASCLRSLFLQRVLVVALFLGDLARGVLQHDLGVLVGFKALPALEQDLGQAGVGDAREAVRRTEHPAEQARQTLQVATLVGGPRLLLVLGLGGLEGLAPGGELPLQASGLLPKSAGARPGGVRSGLGLLQLCADGGDLADPGPQRGLLVLDLRLEH